MSRTVHEVAQHLQNAGSELEAFNEELRQGLRVDVFSQLGDWVAAHAPTVTAPVWSVVNSRCEHLATLASQAGSAETTTQEQARVRSYFQCINPGPIAQELQAACALDVVRASYEATLSLLERSPDVGPIARRYHLPAQVVAALASASMAPLRPALDALGSHAEQMRSHGEVLKSIAAGGGIRGGLGIAASVAGSLVGGRAGAMLARHAMKSVTDPRSKVIASAERVSETFEGFRMAFTLAMEAVDTNVFYTLASLYGGLLLRIEQDLNALGRGLVSVDLDTGDVLVGPDPKSLEDFSTWASTTLEQFRVLKEKQDWAQLGNTSDLALRLTIANPPMTKVGEDETAYAVEFARMRAVALNGAAEMAWSEGRLDDACAIYRQLIGGTNLASDRVDEGFDNPEEEAFRLAGLRLAIAATSHGGDEARLQNDDLAALPAFVAQAMARLARPERWIAAPGEGVAAATILAARAIAEYAEESGSDLRLAQRMPETLSRTGGLDEWNELLRHQGPSYRALLEILGERAHAGEGESSGFLRWLQVKAEEEGKSEEKLGCIALSVAGVVFLVAVVFVIRWLFF